MIEALKNYIGLKGCTTSTPESGKWVNSLPGMSTELVDNLANSEQVSYAKVFEDVQEIAHLRLIDDVVNVLSENVNFNEVILQTKKLIKFSREKEEVLMGDQYRGCYIRLPESKYFSFYLREIYVYSDRAIDTILKVYDVNDGSELYSQDLTLAVGLNTILVDKKFNLKYEILDLFIGVDCSGFNSIKTLRDYYGWYDEDLSCANVCNSSNHSFEYYPAVLNKSDEVTYSNIDREGFGRGVALGAEIGCDVEEFIIQNRKKLIGPLLFLLGAQILQVKLNSPRLNYFTTTNLANTEANMADFNKMYLSNLKRVLKSIPVKGLCFDCDDTLDVFTKGSLA
jgi:hypothetical protein